MSDETLDSMQGDGRHSDAAESRAESGTALRANDELQAPIIADPPDGLDGDRHLDFNVVGVGASAGGVEAYIELFEHLAPNTGMAYVVISHLATDQKSLLCEILARHTDMSVEELTASNHSTALERDRIYVVPPKVLVRMHQGALHLDPPEMAHGKRSIDYFFHSLATDQKNRAVGVVLSGMDSDGALGHRAIKGEGGITMVQTPQSAQFPEMPRSSISADHVDIIAAPGVIAAHLAQLGRQIRQNNLRVLADGGLEAEEREFSRILAMMRTVSGVDFRLYKPATIRRRVARRMLLHRMDTVRDYLLLLQSNAHELAELQEDALINVTQFFRDPEVFEAFKTNLLPHLFEQRDPSQQIRIWIAGCATGEEVYSFAICLLEFLTANGLEPPIQMFGTDASEANIQKARAGLYPDTIAENVSPDRLRRFFTRTERGYQVSKRVRDLC